MAVNCGTFRSHRLRRCFHVHSVLNDEAKVGNGFLSRFFSGQRGQAGQMASHSSLLSDKERIFELITDDTANGDMENYLIQYENYVNVLSRKNESVCLVGSWRVMIGNQKQAVHLWRYDEGYAGKDRHMRDMQVDQELRKANSGTEKLCLRRRSAVLLAFSYWGEPKTRGGSNIYEMRSYVLKPGTMIEWGNNWAKGITYRREYNQDVGGFFSQIGGLYMIFHFWAYESLDHRKKIREDVWSQPGWDTCVQYTVPLIREMQSRIMIPTTFSPMK